ncbi:MAG: alkaline phosphatase family protein [Bdellovibrionales bacterium]|nr:alkaline phosphatase family protein [Bdellovibrionales bacterium]
MKFILSFLFLASVQVATAADDRSSQSLDRLAFGSCNLQLLSQNYYGTIQKFSPQAWIWAGDAVYTDHFPMFMRKLAFQKVKKSKSYRSLMASTEVMGTWDDHEYAANNQGGEYKHKNKTKKLYLDFIGVPAGDIRWSRDGIYWSKTYGPADQSVKIILLDTRYFRDKKQIGKKSQDGFLGRDQWDWLVSELLVDPAKLTFVVSSSQLISNQEGQDDSWSGYPEERLRFLDLAAVSQSHIVILSGDRHYAELAKIDHGGKTFWEFTASGMTHTDKKAPENPLRVDFALRKRNFGLVDVQWDAQNRPQVTVSAKSPKDGKDWFKRSFQPN